MNHLTVGANTFNKNAFSPNVDQNWQDRICIPNAVDCNQNMGAIQFTELSTWGGPSYNGTEQPRLTVKDDLTLTRGAPPAAARCSETTRQRTRSQCPSSISLFCSAEMRDTGATPIGRRGTRACAARTSGGGNISMVPTKAITVGPAETWQADKVSIWHAGSHDNPFGQRACPRASTA